MLRLDANLIFTIINLLVLYLLMRKFLIDPVHKIMEKRQQMIEENISAAETAKSEAMDLKQKYDDQLAAAGTEAAQIISRSKEDAKAEYNRQMQETSQEVAKMKREAQEAMRIEAEQAKKEMQTEVAGLAMAAALKVMGDTNTDLQNKTLYDNFLAEVGEKHENAGN